VTSEPIGPLFLLDGADVMVADDPEDARRQFEAFLVDEPVELFDALARPARLVVSGEVRKRWRSEIDGREIVDVVLVDAEPQEQRLRAALSTYLVSAGLDPPTATDIQSFTSAAAAFIR